MFPKINAEVKSALRFYRKPELRNRNLQRCSEEGSCPPAVFMPNNLLMPFQLVAGMGDQFGHSTPTSWKVYDLDGTLVQDLSSYISSLQVLQFGGPDRDYIMLEEELFLSTALEGKYLEMEIVTQGGTYYSETFTPMCGSTEEIVTDPEVGWANSDFDGLVTDILANTAALPSAPATGSSYLIIADHTIRTWNGSSYNSESAANGDYFTTDPAGGIWYIYTTVGGVAGVVNPPLSLNPLPCWYGNFDTGAEFTVPDFEGGEQAATIETNWTDLSGTFDLLINGTHVAYISSAPTSTDVTLSPGDVVELLPTSLASGCLSKFRIALANGGGKACYHKLSWRSCGDIGTHRYKYNAYRNSFYFPVNDKTFLGEPSPKFDTDIEESEDGENMPVFTRKDTDWRIDLAEVPWWVLDALTEIPLHDDVQLTLQGETEADQIQDVKINYDWNDPCTARVGIEFRVDDPTIGTGCCDAFDALCLVPCAEVDGIEGVDDLVVGNFYGREGTKRFGKYLGPDSGELVDAQDFAFNATCASGLLDFNDGERPYVYWNGTAWEEFVVITQVLDIDCTAGEIRVKATIALPQYGGQVQYTINGEDWINTEGVYSASEFAAGVFVTIPTDTQSIRVMALGTDCNVGFSAKIGSPCYSCDVEGKASITVQDGFIFGSYDGSVFANVRYQDGSITTYASDTPSGLSAGSYCVWFSDGDGNITTPNDVAQFYGLNSTPETLDLSNMSLPEGFEINNVGATVLDFSGSNFGKIESVSNDSLSSIIIGDQPTCTSIYSSSNPVLTSVTVGNIDSCNSVYFQDCALSQASVDALLVAAAASGLAVDVHLDGGTNAEPGSAGTNAIDTIEDNGGTVTTN